MKGEKSPEKWICLLSLLWKFPVSSEKVRNFMEFLDLSRQTLPVQHVFNVAFCMKCLYKSWHWVDLRQTRLRLEFSTGHCSCEKHCRPEIPPNGHGYPGKLWSLAVDPMISTLQPLRNRYNCPGEVRSMKQPYSYFEPLGIHQGTNGQQDMEP